MISIIIPVFNEASGITKLLAHLCANCHGHVREIIIADGGSTDDTVDLINGFITTRASLPITIVNSGKGRARQMNSAAAQAKGDVLYFLHADSFPPLHYDRLILHEIYQGNPAGCFRMRFNKDHWWLNLASWFTQFSWRACRGGDQSQFITRALFNEIGGYDERYIIYEDNILINELYARKKYVVIQQELSSSARLYEKKGIWNLQYHFLVIYVKKWLGAGPDELLAYYLKKIKQDCAAQTPSTSQKENQLDNVYAEHN